MATQQLESARADSRKDVEEILREAQVHTHGSILVMATYQLWQRIGYGNILVMAT